MSKLMFRQVAIFAAIFLVMACSKSDKTEDPDDNPGNPTTEFGKEYLDLWVSMELHHGMQYPLPKNPE